MKIYTRDGDSGETSLVGGGRIEKDAPRVEVCGDVDELNAWIGLVRTEPIPNTLDEVLARIQNELFDLGAEVASPDPARQNTAAIQARHVEALEADIDRLDKDLEPLCEFVLPGGARPASLLHLARAVCRRAERRLVTLAREKDARLSPLLLAHVNRLADLLFVAARFANKEAGRSDVSWEQRGSE